jgi:hypothetical protein
VTESQVPILLAILVAGALVAWVLRRLRPAMPFTTKVLFVVGGGILIGGALYGAIVSR